MDLPQLPYDKTNAISIFEYSKHLLGRTLRDFLPDGYERKRGKGAMGQMVENIYFLLATNSNPAADFSDAGLELKTTPLKEGRSGDLLVKERLVCNMINYEEVVNEDFEHSHFFIKCQLMLLLFYLCEKGADELDMKFLFSVLWRMTEKDLLIIRNDYNTIIEKIRRGEAHLLSEGDTEYLGACRKGQKGDKPVSQPFSETGAQKRAFSLKPSYMRTILRYVQKSGSAAVANYKLPDTEILTKDDLVGVSFENVILRRFTPYIGKEYRDIAMSKDICLANNPKNKFAIIAGALASLQKCANVNRSEEFQKAGLTMKTIRVEANGRIREAMSFENIDYEEVGECDNWYDSRLYELYSSRFLFVVFRENGTCIGNYTLDDVFFWTMPQHDLDNAEKYWQHIRENVLQDHIGDEYWWKERDRRCFHVRPKARVAADKHTTIYGTKAKKYCYWFNRDYVLKIVEGRHHNG